MLNKILQNLTLERIRRNIKLQVFLFSSVVLFFFKIFFSGPASVTLLILNEFLVILAITSLELYFIELMHHRRINPLSLVMNVGILSGLFFFIINFSDPILNGLFDNILEINNQPGLIFNIINFLYAFITLVGASYIFLVYKELYFLKHKRTSTIYFSTMVVFFLLASATSGFAKVPEFDFIPTTFFIISVILIVLNSIKISWIAFLTKKEKLSLLVLSVLISVLFIANLINNTGKEVHLHLIMSLSPALHQFLNLVLIYGIIYFSILFFTTLFHLPTAEAFDKKAREISSLQYFSSLINQVLDFRELEETITDLALKVTGADSSWIMWYKPGDLKTSAHKNIGFVDARLVSEFIMKQAGSPSITTTTIFNLEKFSRQLDFQNSYYFASVSGIRTCNDAQGFLFILSKKDLPFDEEDISAINTFADYSSIAVENCRLLSENIEKERLEKELDVAREIQRKILPDNNPDYPNLSVSSVFIPAFEVGGDYYDFFEFGDSRMGFVIADVSGKGISAAFIMAEIKGIFETLSKLLTSPREILIKANEILKHTLDRRNFVSAAFGIIDLNNEVLTIARAGHCPILLLRDNKAVELKPSGLGLGLNYSDYFSETLQETEINLRDNDTIVLYTDGITEAKNKSLEDFGSILFEKILLENTSKSAAEISNIVIKEVTLFSQNITQHDDITLVILKWKQKFKPDGDKEWQNSAQQLKITVT